MDYESVLSLAKSESLSHHGINGQRWGIRRFQNPDGTLTEAGKKRLAKLKEKNNAQTAEIKKLEGKNKPPTPNPHGKKSVFDMSDEELQKEINRLSLEKRYKDYMKELYPNNSGNKMQYLINGRKVTSDILNTSVKNVGKSVATNVIGSGVNRLGKVFGLTFNLYIDTKNKKVVGN